VSYKLALTAVFVEGFVFVGLSLLGLRQWLARVIPASIKLASGVGIGLYLSMYSFIPCWTTTNIKQHSLA
jgi:AGZA family xanthine/uracil permease-like MFS transporter